MRDEERAWDKFVEPPEACGGEPYVPSASGDMWQLGASLLCMIYGTYMAARERSQSATSQEDAGKQDKSNKKKKTDGKGKK